jgi:hypothetical protein
MQLLACWSLVANLEAEVLRLGLSRQAAGGWVSAQSTCGSGSGSVILVRSQISSTERAEDD